LFQLDDFLKSECSTLNKRDLHSEPSPSSKWHVSSMHIYTSVDIHVVLVPCAAIPGKPKPTPQKQFDTCIFPFSDLILLQLLKTTTKSNVKYSLKNPRK